MGRIFKEREASVTLSGIRFQWKSYAGIHNAVRGKRKLENFLRWLFPSSAEKHVVDESARKMHLSFCIHNMSREVGAESSWFH